MQNSESMDNLEVFFDPNIKIKDKKENKINRKKIIISILLLMIIMGLSCFVAYKYFKNNPTEIVKMVINNTYEDFSSELKKLEDRPLLDSLNIIEDSFKISGNLTIKDKKYKELENEKISYLLGFDYKNKKAEAYIGLLKNSTVIGDFNVYCKHDNLYYLSDTMLNNIYNLGKFDFYNNFNLKELEEDLKKEKRINIEDIDFVIRQFKDALINSLDKDKMTISKEKILVGNEQIKAEKITYDLDYQSFNNLYNSTMEKILSSDETLDKISLIIGLSKEEVKDELSKSLTDLYSDGEMFNDLKFSIYTRETTNKLVKFEIKNDKNAFEAAFMDNQINLVNINGDDRTDVTVKKNENTYDINVKFNNALVASINIKELNEEVISLDYVYKYDKTDIKGSFKLMSNQSNYFDYVIDFDVDSKINNKSYSYGINLTMKIEKNVDVAPKDVSYAIESNTILDDDKYKMSYALYELQNSEIYKYLMKSVSAYSNNSFQNKQPLSLLNNILQ